MTLVRASRGKSTRGATGGLRAAPFLRVDRGEESRVLLRSALRSAASPQTALRRTRDSSPHYLLWSRTRSPVLLRGGVGGRIGGQGARLRHETPPEDPHQPPCCRDVELGRPRASWVVSVTQAPQKIGGGASVARNELPAKPPPPLGAVRWRPPPAHMKRVVRSVAGQSAAFGGRAKR